MAHSDHRLATDAKIVAIVRFDGCVQYLDAASWDADRARHCVPSGDAMDWAGPGNPAVPRMFGWHVAAVLPIAQPMLAPEKKGVIGCAYVTHLVL